MLGIAALGLSLGRHNNYQITPSELHHNFYIMLVGPSTLSHKSTSVKLWFQLIDRGYRAPYHFSPESFYRYLSENSQSVLFFDEFGSVIKKMVRKNSYMSQFADDLNTFYDCPEELTVQLNKLITRDNPSGILLMQNIYLFVIGCTTPEALEKNLDPELLQGGLFPRFLIINTDFCDYHEPRELSHAEQEDLRLMKQDLRSYLDRISDMRFGFQWMDDARKCLADYMMNSINEMRNNGGFDNSSIIGRAENSIRKIANLYAINETTIPANPERSRRFNVRITREIVEKALNFVQQCTNDAIDIKGRVSLSQILAVVRKRLTKMQGYIAHSKLLQNSHLLAEDFKKGITTLVETEEIMRFTHNNFPYYCTPTLKLKCESCNMRDICRIDEKAMRLAEKENTERNGHLEEEEYKEEEVEEGGGEKSSALPPSPFKKGKLV